MGLSTPDRHQICDRRLGLRAGVIRPLNRECLSGRRGPGGVEPQVQAAERQIVGEDHPHRRSGVVLQPETLAQKLAGSDSRPGRRVDVVRAAAGQRERVNPRPILGDHFRPGQCLVRWGRREREGDHAGRGVAQRVFVGRQGVRRCPRNSDAGERQRVSAATTGMPMAVAAEKLCRRSRWRVHRGAVNTDDLRSRRCAAEIGPDLNRCGTRGSLIRARPQGA